MLLPNKTVSYNESILSKFPLILQCFENTNNMSVGNLYKLTKEKFNSINIFIQTLDCLFALNKIILNKENGELALC